MYHLFSLTAGATTVGGPQQLCGECHEEDAEMNGTAFEALQAAKQLATVAESRARNTVRKIKVGGK